MYLRITRARFDPTRHDEVLPLMREGNAAVQELPGFQRLEQGVDRNAGIIVEVSIWESEEHARFSRDRLGDVPPHLHALGVQLDPPEIYEIVD